MVSQVKTLNMFYLSIYWTQEVHNDFMFLCSIVLPRVGHFSNHEYHCWNLQDNGAVVRIVIAIFKDFSWLSLVFILEQTVTSNPYCINWLFFVTEMKSVYSAVGTGSLNKAVCASYFSTNSDLCHLQHKLIGFYNRDEKCLQRGTDWVFK